MTATDTARIVTGDDYIESLRGRKLKVFFLGERVEEPAITPSSAPPLTLSLAPTISPSNSPISRTAPSALSGQRVNRFLHITESAEDLVTQNKMQRRLGQLTGTCFQRCVGMDAINSLYSVTYEIDQEHGTPYHERFLNASWSRLNAQLRDRRRDDGSQGRPRQGAADQSDPDLFVHIMRRPPDGIILRGAEDAPDRMHQFALDHRHADAAPRPGGHDYADRRRLPVDAPGTTFIYGRQSCDTRSTGRGDIDAGQQAHFPVRKR